MSISQPTSYDISELSDLSGLTVRTIRYYIQQRLLPTSQSMGPGAKYGEAHLARLRLIRRLQRDHHPLAEIRRRLESPDADAAQESATGSSAADYVRAVLEKGATPAPASQAQTLLTSPPPPATRDRSHWERIPLTDGIEIHVRRPLSRADNRSVERLLDAARHIFEE